jgi:hypothetical protein
MLPDGQDSGTASCGPNSGGAGTGYPDTPVVAPFLLLHGAALVALGGVEYELRYPIAAPCFGEREIDVVDAVLPVVAQSEQDALEIAAIVLREHEPPELPQVQPATEEATPPRSGYHQAIRQQHRDS